MNCQKTTFTGTDEFGERICAVRGKSGGFILSTLHKRRPICVSVNAETAKALAAWITGPLPDAATGHVLEDKEPKQ